MSPYHSTNGARTSNPIPNCGSMTLWVSTSLCGLAHRDVFGHEATVTVIDVRAAQGAGVITVKYDDGRTAQSMALAHGFERVNA